MDMFVILWSAACAALFNTSILPGHYLIKTKYAKFKSANKGFRINNNVNNSPLATS